MRNTVGEVPPPNEAVVQILNERYSASRGGIPLGAIVTPLPDFRAPVPVIRRLPASCPNCCSVINSYCKVIPPPPRPRGRAWRERPRRPAEVLAPHGVARLLGGNWECSQERPTEPDTDGRNYLLHS
jgi:hypothetical protein